MLYGKHNFMYNVAAIGISPIDIHVQEVYLIRDDR